MCFFGKFKRVVSFLTLIAFLLTNISYASPAKLRVPMSVPKDIERIAGALETNGGKTVVKDVENILQSESFIDGVNVKLPAGVRYEGKVDRVITIADYSGTMAPKLAPLKGKYLDAVLGNIEASDLYVVSTGEAFGDIWENFAKQVMPRLSSEDRKKVNVLYNSGDGAFGITLNGQRENYWMPEILSHKERKDCTVASIEAFWDNLKKWKDALGLSEDLIDRKKKETVSYFRKSVTKTKKWKEASPLLGKDDVSKYHITPEELGLGDIYVTDSGNGLIFEFVYASDKLKEVLGGDIFPLTSLMKQQVDKSLTAEKIKYVVAGPSFLDMTQAQKAGGVMRLLALPQIKEKIDKGRTAIFILGDSTNDSHLDLKDEDFRSVGIEEPVVIPIFVGENEKVAEKFGSKVIITIAKNQDGGAFALNVASQAVDKDLSEVIAAKQIPSEHSVPLQPLENVTVFADDLSGTLVGYSISREGYRIAEEPSQGLVDFYRERFRVVCCQVIVTGDRVDDVIMDWERHFDANLRLNIFALSLSGTRCYRFSSQTERPRLVFKMEDFFTQKQKTNWKRFRGKWIEAINQAAAIYLGSYMKAFEFKGYDKQIKYLYRYGYVDDRGSMASIVLRKVNVISGYMDLDEHELTANIDDIKTISKEDAQEINRKIKELGIQEIPLVKEGDNHRGTIMKFLNAVFNGTEFAEFGFVPSLLPVKDFAIDITPIQWDKGIGLVKLKESGELNKVIGHDVDWDKEVEMHGDGFGVNPDGTPASNDEYMHIALPNTPFVKVKNPQDLLNNYYERMTGGNKLKTDLEAVSQAREAI